VRAKLSLAVSLVLAGAPALAADTGDSFAEAIVELHINGQAEGSTLVVRHDTDGTLLIKASDLPALHLKTPASGAVMVNGERYYRLGTEIGASVTLDTATQTANVTLPAGAFAGSSTRVGSHDIPPPIAGFGGFANYDIYAEQTSGPDVVGAFVETGLFSPYGVLTDSMLVRYDDERRGAVRLDSTWTTDFPQRASTLRVGDAISVSGAWGRSVRFGGLQFGTNFSTQPTLITTPMLTAHGDAVVPSTVDIFVNGQPVASQDVPAGPFTINQVPAITGSGQMQVVVTDALGRQQIIAQSYYTGPSLLREGLSEYSFEVGAIRQRYGSSSNSYGSMVAAATYRRGLTDTFTAEVHAEGMANGAKAIGADASWQVGSVGVLSLTAAAGGDGSNGWLAGAGFEHAGDRVSVFARSQVASRTFSQLGSSPNEPQPRQRLFGGLGFDLGNLGSLHLAYGLQTFWSAPSEQMLGISHSVTLGAYGFLNFIANQSIGSNRATDLFLNWTLPFGERKTANVSLQHASDPGAGRDNFEAVATLQKGLPVGPGTGYRMLVSSAGDGQLGYSLQGHAGTAEVDYARRNGVDGVRAGLTGGIAVTSAGIMPSRRLDQSFAVVKVADYPGMTVLVENQPVGRTDSRGRILLDTLRPYQRNQISVDPTQLPMDASLSTSKIEVTPSYRSGAVVAFPVHRASAVTFRLVQEDGSPVPAGATVTLGETSSPVALDGLVYLADAAGRHDAVATWVDHRCSFGFERREGNDPLPDLGTIVCHAMGH
jgi:outer membrane usher protein